MKLQVRLVLRDEDVAYDVGDKLLGRRGTIERDLCWRLAQELLKSGQVKIEWTRDHVMDRHICQASVIVGVEHQVIAETIPPLSDMDAYLNNKYRGY